MINEKRISDIERRLDRVPGRFPSLTSATQTSPYLGLLIKGGNTLLVSGPVYGIKRVAGEALFDPGDPLGTERAAATCALTSGAVSSVSLSNLGRGYVSAPTVTVGAPPGGGTQAVITASVASSVVDYVYVTACGSGYTFTPTVTFSAPGSGTTATGTALLRDGKVVAIAVANRGSGYASPPTVTITSGGGSGATAAAVLMAGSLSLSITTAGAGYVTAPSITIAAPPAIAASHAYPDGLGIATVKSTLAYGPTQVSSPAVNSNVLVVHDDRSLIAYGLMGEGPSVPLSRPPDGVATWYQTLVKIDGADADADGVVSAFVPMFGGV